MIKLTQLFYPPENIMSIQARTFLRRSAVPQTLRDEVVDELENQL